MAPPLGLSNAKIEPIQTVSLSMRIDTLLGGGYEGEWFSF
jgi:hypothetical protein